MIPLQPKLRRRVPASQSNAFRPAGTPIAPANENPAGAWRVTLSVTPTATQPPTAAAVTANLAAALRAPDLALAGPPTVRSVSVNATPGSDTRTYEVSAVLDAPARWGVRNVVRALARAVYWSIPGLNRGSADTDGGASIVQTIETDAPRGAFARASFRAEPTAAPVAPRPAPTTPAQPAPAPIATVPLGKPQAQLTRPEVVRFQQALVALGYANGGRTVADGALGPNTRASTLAFQQAHQRTNAALPARVRSFLAAVEPLGTDGNLGPATQRALNWYLLPVDNGGGGLSIASVPVQQGGATPVVRPPAPAPSTPGTTPVVRPPAPDAAPPVRSAPAQAGMSGTTIALAALGAAVVGAGLAYKDKLFGRTGAAGRIARRARSGGGR